MFDFIFLKKKEKKEKKINKQKKKKCSNLKSYSPFNAWIE